MYTINSFQMIYVCNQCDYKLHRKPELSGSNSDKKVYKEQLHISNDFKMHSIIFGLYILLTFNAILGK